MIREFIRKYIFSVKEIDDHIKINFFGLHPNFRIKTNLVFPEITESGVSGENRQSGRIICSLTSIPPRIKYVDRVVRCLLAQTKKPDMVVLWLASDEFPEGESSLPQRLLDLKKFGLTIKFCKNYRSYKKLVPALMEFPEDYILTFDDDIYYGRDTVQNLWESSLKNPGCVCCYRTGRIDLVDGKIKPIPNSVLIWNHPRDAAFNNVIMSGTGTLFPPHSLYRDILDESVFMKLMPSNDEIFFWGMAVLNGTKIVNTMGFGYKCVMLREQQHTALNKINVEGSAAGIDGKSALQLIAKTYPRIISIIEEGMRK